MNARAKNRDSFSVLFSRDDIQDGFIEYLELKIPAFWDRLADIFTEA